MSAKSMFYRLFRIPQKPDTSTWNVEFDQQAPNIPSGDAATIPMKTWEARHGVKALIEGEAETDVQKSSEPAFAVDVVIMRWLPTEEEVTGWASRNLRRLSPETIAAGLRAYVQQHPVTA